MSSCCDICDGALSRGCTIAVIIRENSDLQPCLQTSPLQYQIGTISRRCSNIALEMCNIVLEMCDIVLEMCDIVLEICLIRHSSSHIERRYSKIFVSVSINFYIILLHYSIRSICLDITIASQLSDLSLYYCCLGEKVFDNTSLNLQFMVLLDLHNSFKHNQASRFDFSFQLFVARILATSCCMIAFITAYCPIVDNHGMTTDFGS